MSQRFVDLTSGKLKRIAHDYLAWVTYQVGIEQKTSGKAENSTTTKQRFILDKENNVIDTVNPYLAPEVYRWADEPKDESDLRNSVLWVRLARLVDDLIINLSPEEEDRWGNKFRPHNDEAHSISWAIYRVIQASCLNARVAPTYGGNRSDEKITREKGCWQAITSIGLFCDDIERLLVYIYGDIERNALQESLNAVAVVVEELTRYVRTDLWQEHKYAKDSDHYLIGIGWPDYLGISGSDIRHGLAAHAGLRERAHLVLKSPSVFSKYSVEFAKRFDEKSKKEGWPGDEPARCDDDIPF